MVELDCPLTRATHPRISQPWDGLKGYAMVYGVTRLTRTTFTRFYGGSACAGSYRTFALGNHVKVGGRMAWPAKPCPATTLPVQAG